MTPPSAGPPIDPATSLEITSTEGHEQGRVVRETRGHVATSRAGGSLPASGERVVLP